MMIHGFRLLRTLHAWAGMTLALLLMVIALSGSLLVWKEDYLRLTIPEARADFEPTPEALAGIARRVEAQFEVNDLMSLYFPTEDFALAKISLYPDHYVYLDTEGNIVEEWRGNERWEEWLFDLHHRLLLADTGLLIVGFGAMAMLILVLVGVIVWWPLRRGWRLGLVPKSLARVQLLKAHRNLGILVALPLLVTLSTGIILVFPAESEALLLESHRGSDEYNMAMLEGLDDISGGNSGDWEPAMERSLAVFPDARIRSAQVPSAFNSYRVIGLQQEGEWNPLGMSKVYIDAPEGYMDIRMDAQSYPAIERAYNAVYPVHTGRMDVLWYKILLTVVGLLVFIISGMGLLSFIRRYYRSRGQYGQQG